MSSGRARELSPGRRKVGSVVLALVLAACSGSDHSGHCPPQDCKDCFAEFVDKSCVLVCRDDTNHEWFSCPVHN